MAAKCGVKTVRLSAIYDTVRALVKEDANINSLQDVIDWFAANEPAINSEEIIDSLVIPSPKNISAETKRLSARKNELRKQAKMIQKLERLLTGTLEKYSQKPKSPEAALTTEMRNAIDNLRKMSADPDISQDQIDAAVDALESLPLSVTPDTEGVIAAIENLKQLKADAKTHPKNPVEEAAKQAIARDQLKAKNLAAKIEGLLKGQAPKTKKPRVPPSDEVKEFADTLDQLYKLANEDPDLSPAVFGDTLLRLKTLESLYQQYFDATTEISEEAIQRAIETIRGVKTAMQVEQLDRKLAEIN